MVFASSKGEARSALTQLLCFTLRWLVLSGVVTGSLGCASSSAPLFEVLSLVRLGVDPALQAKFEPSALNPKFRYLKAIVEDRAPVLLVLGYLDPHPAGDIEVWYSAQREVVKIQNGRIVSTAGLTLDWRSTTFPIAPPTWTEVRADGVDYVRARDEMPSGRYSVTEQVHLNRLLTPPQINLSESMSPDQVGSYVWFSETYDADDGKQVPPAWFAVDLHRQTASVAYSEQCLSATLCMKLQAWPPRKPGP